MNFQSTKMPAELRRTNPEEKVSLKMSSGEIKKPLVNERLDFIGGNEGGADPLTSALRTHNPVFNKTR